MKMHDVFSYSFSAIKLRKLRASLTTLGVVIGIAAIVALLSITQGLQTTITDQLQRGLSADTLIVVSGSNALGGGGNEGGGFSGGGIGTSSSSARLYLNYTDEINALSPNIVTSLAEIGRAHV